MVEGALTGGIEAPVSEAAMTMPKPRGYQQEMLAESLRKNIIVAVCTSHLRENTCASKTDILQTRWTPEAVRHKCTSIDDVIHAFHYLSLLIIRAILRIQEELGRCPPNKVSQLVLICTTVESVYIC
jgi:hypothetical protein